MGRKSRKLLYNTLLVEKQKQIEASAPPPPDKVEDPEFALGQRVLSVSEAERIQREREQQAKDAVGRLQAVQDQLNEKRQTLKQQEEEIRRFQQEQEAQARVEQAVSEAVSQDRKDRGIPPPQPGPPPDEGELAVSNQYHPPSSAPTSGGGFLDSLAGLIGGFFDAIFGG